MNVVLLICGELGFEVLNYFTNSSVHDVNCIFTDSSSSRIIDKANKSGLPLIVGRPDPNRHLNYLLSLKLDLVLSVNYIFIIDKSFFVICKNFINIHGSLLPRYRGRTPHVWAIINNEKYTGVTAHLMEEGVDTGAIVRQVVIPIEIDDTGYSLLQKFSKVYLSIIEDILVELETGDLRVFAQDESKATFFGIRRPSDGLISWDWQKERLYNWVRAQSFPYPGAYTFHNGVKVIIDEIEFSDFAFNYLQDNGTVISIKPLLVKVSNGVVNLKRVRDESFLLCMNIGDIFG